MQLSIITQVVKRRFCRDFYALDKVQKTWTSKSGMLPSSSITRQEKTTVNKRFYRVIEHSVFRQYF